MGWLDDRPLLGLVRAVCVVEESRAGGRVSADGAGARAAEVGAARGVERKLTVERRTFDAWGIDRSDGDWRRHVGDARRAVDARSSYRVTILPLCERLRLMFFGNSDQVWSEFVLADLGIFQYEKVAVPPEARAFQTRRHIDDFHAIHRCRERFERDEPTAAVLEELPPRIEDNPWLESRRTKLLFRLAQRHEKSGRSRGRADVCIRTAPTPAHAVRAIRVLERTERSGSKPQCSPEAAARCAREMKSSANSSRE